MAKGLYKEWQKPENLTLLKGWRRDGLELQQIAKNMGIRRQTLYTWCQKYSDIADALKKGNEVCVYEVENAMYKAAMGYDVTETEQTETIYPDGSKVTVKRARKRHIPPSVGAICFILKNRAGDKWKDKPIYVDNTALKKLDDILKATREAAESEVLIEESKEYEVQPETE